MAEIVVNQVSKSYEKCVLGPCSFCVGSNQTLAVMGPSGSGKSTLLKAIAGLIEFEGEILLKEAQRVCVVFDDALCLDHLKVFDNIALGMKKEGFSRMEIEERVNKIAEEVQLSDYLDKRPDELSYGQRQRVGLARALVRDFDVLLMDEPFSGLDILLRKQMLDLISQMQKQKGFVCVYVTHDHRDARIFSDHILILKEGQIVMLDGYEECLAHPKDDFVEAFLK